jgi:cellulose synthase/poly-beta-1,6-N-acetylglucosamine synthase-like glycosyltransferase
LLATPYADLFFFFLFAFGVLLHFAGYIFVLTLIRRLRPRRIAHETQRSDDPGLPAVTVVVPVRNEEGFIRQKLENLFSLDYPAARLEVIVVDGGSTDGTRRIVEDIATSAPRYRVTWLAAASSGKIPQLNEALASIPADHLVVVTDVDAVIAPADALLRTVGYFSADEKVGLVGGWTMPPAERGLIVHAEHAYWDKQNRLRHMETIAFSSSIVVGPFYAFPRKFHGAFPEDCIADDVHASFACHLGGRRVIYADDIQVVEYRFARRLSELFSHKRRKTYAYTVEILRVMHRLPFMGKRLKFFWGAKLFQFFYLPWACLGLLVWSLRLAALGAGDLVMATGVVLVGCTLAASLLMTPPPGRRRGGFEISSIASSAVTFSLMFVVLFVNFFTFPFRREDSAYSRLPEAPRGRAGS